MITAYKNTVLLTVELYISISKCLRLPTHRGLLLSQCDETVSCRFMLFVAFSNIYALLLIIVILIKKICSRSSMSCVVRLAQQNEIQPVFIFIFLYDNHVVLVCVIIRYIVSVYEHIVCIFYIIHVLLYCGII